MSRELYYIDENGKKQDAALHAEMLREDDHQFQLDQTAMLLRELRASGDDKGFKMFKRQYDEAVKRHGLTPHEDLK